MAVMVWLFLLISLMPDGDCHDEDPACRSIRMARKFPCDVTECGSNVTFDCSWRHLKNLSDISDKIFLNTTILNLKDNSILKISQDAFSKLSNLTVLDLRWVNGNRDVTIHKKVFWNLNNLQELRLAGIGLNSVPRCLPASLKILDISDSHFVSLDWLVQLSGKENITKLWLSKNCYSENPCYVSFNITDNAFDSMRKLQHLDLSFNNLTSVPKNLPKSLLNLNLGGNRIEYISRDDFRGLHNLKQLMLQKNCPRCQTAPFPCVPCKNGSLQIHPHAFSNLTALQMMNMGGNSLEYLKGFWFENMPNLKTLLLPFNFLLKTITEEAEWLKCLPKLEILDLSFNFALRSYLPTLNLSTNFSYLKSLKTLHLEGEFFKTIDSHTLAPLYQLKNLSVINLGTNFIMKIDSKMFRKFPPLKLIFLAENRLYPISVKNPHQLNLDHQMPETISTSPLTRKFPAYGFHRHVKEECYNAGNVLVLSRNNIFFMSEEQLKGYGNIACLNLSYNGFSVALNGTEFSPLPNLTYLDLSHNNINLAYSRAFKDLPKLKVLDISYNSHYFEAVGIAINLNFTLNLPVLRVLNMSYNKINSLATKEMYSESLSQLQFTNNNLGDLWEDMAYYNLFTHLTNLSILDISSNSIKRIPQQIYKNLPRNLTQLHINNNRLKTFAWDQLKVFYQLQILDLSHNLITKLKFRSNNAPSLNVLDLSFNHIIQIDDGILSDGNHLKTLYLNHNKLSIINQSTFASRPENELETLFIHNNPFQCTCDSLDFILWMEKSTVKIPQLTTDVKCGTPKILKNLHFIEFDINQCVSDSQAFIYYIVTSTCIFTFTVVTIVAHLFYWDAFYILHLLKAKLKGYHSLHSPGSVYDVFVTYDTNDPYVNEWVMEKLLVELEEEGEKHHPLCLEERDWFPGTPLLDNLTHSIRNSRKTLFVLTENYVKTGMFKLAMYLAHQRLLDENVDVILVLMLDPVLQHSHFLRLRRRLCGQSVLEWPKNAAAESWFWQNLKSIIKVDNEVLYSKTYIQYFTSR